MKAALRTLAMLWLPGLIILLGGLPALLRTGQVDPRGWMLPALLLIPASALLKARRGEGAAWWAGLGTVGMVLACAFLASWRVPGLVPVAWFLSVALLGVSAGLQLGPIRAPAKAGAHFRRFNWASAFAGALQLVGTALALFVLAACWLARVPRIEPLPGARPKLAIISALPLFWKAEASGLPVPVDAPIITVLRQRFDVRPVDSPLALEKGKVKALLLAQPRALSMDELVALDAWVQDGGTALVLADPQLRWPMDLPPGDRRRPPAVTSLAAIIEHWRVKLAPLGQDADERRHFLGDGRMLTVYAASGFKGAGPACRIPGRGLVARCMVGRGSATIVADADLIDDRLWLADSAEPLRPDRWTADTPQFVAQALGAALPEGRRWVRSGEMVVGAVRWSVLIGFFWAGLGMLLFRRRQRTPFVPVTTATIHQKPGLGD